MTVIAMDNGSDKLRGELKKWLLEIKPGVFVGRPSALVREHLWRHVCGSIGVIGAVLVYNTNTEQGFAMKMYGIPYRKVVDLDGIQLISIEECR